MTLVEVFAVLLTVLILVGVILPPRSPVSHSVRINCVNNLRNVGLSYQIFATDNHDRIPFELSTNDGGTRELGADVAGQFRCLSNELVTPKILVCPRTRRPLSPTVPATNWTSLTSANISYYLCLNASNSNPSSILSGDSGFLLNGAQPKPGLVRISTNETIAYPKKFHDTSDDGNVALADGSVSMAKNVAWRELLVNTSLATNEFVLP